jgi:hypothetical protein
MSQRQSRHYWKNTFTTLVRTSINVRTAHPTGDAPTAFQQLPHPSSHPPPNYAAAHSSASAAPGNATSPHPSRWYFPHANCPGGPGSSYYAASGSRCGRRGCAVTRSMLAQCPASVLYSRGTCSAGYNLCERRLKDKGKSNEPVRANIVRVFLAPARAACDEG